MQGWYARLYTALGLGVIARRRVWRLYEASLDVHAGLAVRACPRPSALVLGWFIFRIVQFPPFAEFLIATEAEMNKVSWTSKDDLYRATIVVLATVLLMAVFLFGVDWLWCSSSATSACSSSAAEAASARPPEPDAAARPPITSRPSASIREPADLRPVSTRFAATGPICRLRS